MNMNQPALLAVVLGILLVFWPGATVVQGQQPSAMEKPSLENLEQRFAEQMREIESSLEGLNEISDDLDVQLQAPSKEQNLRDQVQKLQAENQQSSQQLTEIQKRLLLIQELRKSSNQQAIDENALTDPPRFSPETNDPASQSSDVSFADQLDKMSPSVSIESATARTPSNAASRQLDEVLSHFELANSLFSMKEYQAAFENYQLVEIEQLNNNDLVWLEYVKATCLRRLGSLTEAEALYRSVANKDSKNPLVISSRNWLQILKTQKTISRFGDLDYEYDLIVSITKEMLENE